jgi:hypothetical protein
VSPDFEDVGSSSKAIGLSGGKTRSYEGYLAGFIGDETKWWLKKEYEQQSNIIAD